MFANKPKINTYQYPSTDTYLSTFNGDVVNNPPTDQSIFKAIK